MITPAPSERDPGDRAHAWLRGAMLALAVLAAAAAVVSWDAQYVLVRSVKHSAVIAALEAGIPDVGAVIFAALGIAVALDGKHALRARTLNVACVGLSLGMNALASSPGWRDLAIWVMPSALYALASDTLIGVIRAWALARKQHTSQALAPDDEATPIAVLGGLFLWLLRLTLGPVSTITGFRQWVLEECPIAPGRKATRPCHPAPHASRETAPRHRPRPEAARQAGPDDRAGRPAARPHHAPPRAGVRDREHHRRRGGPVPRHRPPRAPRPRPRPAKRPPAEGNDPMRHHAIEIITLFAVAADRADRDQVGVPAVPPLPPAAPQPGPPPAPARAPAAAPRRRARHRRWSCGCGGAGSRSSAAAAGPAGP